FIMDDMRTDLIEIALEALSRDDEAIKFFVRGVWIWFAGQGAAHFLSASRHIKDMDADRLSDASAFISSFRYCFEAMRDMLPVDVYLAFFPTMVEFLTFPIITLGEEMLLIESPFGSDFRNRPGKGHR